MSESVDKYNRPTRLESPEDLQYAPYRLDSRFINPLNKTTADRTVTFEESMYMVDVLLRKYESTFYNHRYDNSIILMPYLFSKPSKNDQIKNVTTGELYTIKETIDNPITKIWEGLVKLNYIAYPNRELGHKLEFVSEKNTVRFTEDPAIKLDNESQTEDSIMIDKGPMRPTITYSLERKEPGSTDGTPFGQRKEYKSRHREYVKDVDFPNHTYELRGQYFDNLVQFDCCTVDNFSANRLARWFGKFIQLYEWVLKKNGVQQILFLKEFRNATQQKGRLDLVVRSLQYYFRTEEVEAISRRDLTAINYTINLAAANTDSSVRYIAGQLVSGQISEQEYNDLFRDSSGKYLFGNVYLNDGNL